MFHFCRSCGHHIEISMDDASRTDEGFAPPPAEDKPDLIVALCAACRRILTGDTNER